VDTIPFISRPDDVTPAWLTTVLTAAGVTSGCTVVDVQARSVGTGQVGDSVRFTLTWDRADAGPATVVGKFPTDDETSRATATAVRTYEVETRFYQQLRSRVDIAAPVPYYAQIDMATHDFAILMNDLAPAEQGDQIAGCGADDGADVRNVGETAGSASGSASGSRARVAAIASSTSCTCSRVSSRPHSE